MRHALLLLLALAACGEPKEEDMPSWPGAGPYQVERFRPSRPGDPPSVGLSYPPDGLEVARGLWGYDIDESRVVRRTGERSVWFKNTSTLITGMQDDAAHLMPVEAGRRYKTWAIFQADSKVSGQNVDAIVRWLGADKTTLISSSTIYGSPVTTIDTWQRAEAIALAPTGAYYARAYFGRTHSGTSFNAYFDEVDMLEAVPLWDANGEGTQSVVSATPTVVIFGATQSEVDVDYDSATGIATIQVAGHYFVSAAVPIVALASDVTVTLELLVNGTRRGLALTRTYRSAGTEDYVGPGVYFLRELAVDDQVKVQITHNAGSNKTVSGVFSGLRIM